MTAVSCSQKQDSRFNLNYLREKRKRKSRQVLSLIHRSSTVMIFVFQHLYTWSALCSHNFCSGLIIVRKQLDYINLVWRYYDQQTKQNDFTLYLNLQKCLRQHILSRMIFRPLWSSRTNWLLMFTCLLINLFVWIYFHIQQAWENTRSPVFSLKKFEVNYSVSSWLPFSLHQIFRELSDPLKAKCSSHDH